MKKIAIVALLFLCGFGKPPLSVRQNQHVEFALTFPYSHEPEASGAMFESRKSMFVVDSFSHQGDGFVIYGTGPANQLPGKYTLKEIVIDYGFKQTILTSPVDFPAYKIKVEADDKLTDGAIHTH